MKNKDKFGVTWDLPKDEICSTCGQPDNSGDCNHQQLSKEEVKMLGGKTYKTKKS